MPSNKNSLTYLCLDKIIQMTKKVEEPNEDSLQWVSSAWAGVIRRLPLLYKTYSYLQLLKAPLDFKVALNIQCKDLVVTYYQKDEKLYLCLDRKYYKTLLQNIAFKKYLNNKVNGLKIYRSTSATQLSDAVELKTFLSNCNAVKKVTLNDNFMTRVNYKNIILRIVNNIHLSKKERILVREVEDLELLLQCLTQCPNIEIMENLHIVDPKIFSKFILGIEYVDCILNDEIFDVNRIVLSSNPSWPKLKSVEMPFNFLNPFYKSYHIHNLSFLILKDLNNVLPRLGCEGFIEYTFTKLLSSGERNNALVHIRPWLKHISTDYLELFPFVQLIGSPVTIQLNLISDDFEQNMKILKGCVDISSKKIKFNIVQVKSCPTIKFEQRLNIIKNQYPIIIERISKFCCCNDNNIDIVTHLITFISNASNLQVLKLICTRDFDIDESLLPVCLTDIPNFIFITYNVKDYSHYIQKYITMFPNTQNFTLKFLNNFRKSNTKLTTSNLDFVNYLKNLNSFYINFIDYWMSTNDLIKFLVKISRRIDRGVKLFYSVNHVHLDPCVQSVLRNRGWHLYIE